MIAPAPMGLNKAVIEELSRISEDLYNFLVSSDKTPENKKLNTLLESVKSLKVKLNEKAYAGFVYDSNGYIIKVFNLGDFEEVSKIPADITGGYYKYVNRGFVLDEERRRQLDEV